MKAFILGGTWNVVGVDPGDSAKGAQPSMVIHGATSLAINGEEAIRSLVEACEYALSYKPVMMAPAALDAIAHVHQESTSDTTFSHYCRAWRDAERFHGIGS